MLPSSTPNVQRPTKPPGTVGPTTMPSPKVAHSALTVATNPFPTSDESQRKLKPPQNGNVHSSQNKAIPEIKLTGFVGFDSLPYQLVRKCQESGFQFNLLCVGETGMGKTTLLESLFNMKMEFEQCNRELKTVELREKTFDVQEGAVKVKLRVVETAGFGDQLDKEKSLSKDMTGRNEVYRAPAICALCLILTNTFMLQGIECYMKRAIVGKTALVSSAALVSSHHLMRKNPEDAVSADNHMVQFDALSLLVQVRANNRLAILKMVQKQSDKGRDWP